MRGGRREEDELTCSADASSMICHTAITKTAAAVANKPFSHMLRAKRMSRLRFALTRFSCVLLASTIDGMIACDKRDSKPATLSCTLHRNWHGGSSEGRGLESCGTCVVQLAQPAAHGRVVTLQSFPRALFGAVVGDLAPLATATGGSNSAAGQSSGRVRACRQAAAAQGACTAQRACTAGSGDRKEHARLVRELEPPAGGHRAARELCAFALARPAAGAKVEEEA